MVGGTGASGTVVAMVPAAGSGERLGAGVPKAFYQLEGQTLVERAVDGLLDSGVVNTVVVAAPPGLADEAKLILGDKATVVAGGANRAESVRLALAASGGHGPLHMHGNLRGAGGNITTRPENHSDWSARTRAGRSHVLFEPDVSGGGYVATVAAGKPAGWRSTAGGEYLAEFLGRLDFLLCRR